VFIHVVIAVPDIIFVDPAAPHILAAIGATCRRLTFVLVGAYARVDGPLTRGSGVTLLAGYRRVFLTGLVTSEVNQAVARLQIELALPRCLVAGVLGAGIGVAAVLQRSYAFSHVVAHIIISAEIVVVTRRGRGFVLSNTPLAGARIDADPRSTLSVQRRVRLAVGVSGA